MATNYTHDAGHAQAIQIAHDRAQQLQAELSAISRVQDPDEIRRRAGWAAADAESLRDLLAPLQS